MYKTLRNAIKWSNRLMSLRPSTEIYQLYSGLFYCADGIIEREWAAKNAVLVAKFDPAREVIVKL